MADTPELRESYDALLASLRLSAAFDHGKSLLVTSARPSEGKTTVAACLALTAALAGQKAMLIDGDLRRPSLLCGTGRDGGIGFGEVLDGNANPLDAIQAAELLDSAQRPHTLWVIGAGRKSPSFLSGVDRSKARTAFRSVTQDFDIVFVDSSPILAANDALLLAGIVDAVLIVVGGDAHADEVRRAKQLLDPIGTPVIGAVLNEFDPKLHGRPSQPYRDYYLGSPR